MLRKPCICQLKCLVFSLPKIYAIHSEGVPKMKMPNFLTVYSTIQSELRFHTRPWGIDKPVSLWSLHVRYSSVKHAFRESTWISHSTTVVGQPLHLCKLPEPISTLNERCWHRHGNRWHKDMVSGTSRHPPMPKLGVSCSARRLNYCLWVAIDTMACS